MAEDLPSWKAGTASAVITPAESMWLAGWVVRTEPSRGTVSDLHAKAIALEDPGGGRFVLITMDLIAVSREIASAVAAEVGRRHSLPRDRLMFCASHTHCGPEIRPDKVPYFYIPPEYAAKIVPYGERLTRELIALVAKALSGLERVRLTVRQTSAPFAHNRRGGEGIDHDVPTLEVISADGRRRAVVFGYACHNTTMPPLDYRYCGDYAGFAQASLASDTADASLFVAGAGADQNPDPRGTIDLAREHGRTLADAVRHCLTDGDAHEITGTLRVAYDEIPLEFQPLPPRDVIEADRRSDDRYVRTKAEQLLAGLDRGETFPPTYPCPLHVVQFGDALLLIGIGGEPVIDYAHALKRKYAAPGRIVWVAGYTNDMFGYIPTARVLREGGYEGTKSVLWSALPTPFAQSTEARVIAGVERLVHQL